MKKSNQTQIKKIAEQAAKVMAQLEEMKPLYNQLEELTAQLVGMGVDVVAIEGKKIIVVDNFATKNTVFKTTSVKRFELKVG